ncbi:class I SAM-dependent methyltransferase [Pseudarthrobacter oxydans]|uniref:SAM-dependent methyltransferase n=1 Tax=Pseudarthrobacter oxydans TaxID=1671 RepID=UPI003416BDB9
MPGQACVDIGCGYGSTAGRLAVTRGVRVTGFTLSAEQARYANAHPVPGVDIQVSDWLANGLADESADAAWAIESSEHMVDKPRFFAEATACSRPAAASSSAAGSPGTVLAAGRSDTCLSRSAARGACPRWARARSMRRCNGGRL